jgi:hypothetical protein
VYPQVCMWKCLGRAIACTLLKHFDIRRWGYPLLMSCVNSQLCFVTCQFSVFGFREVNGGFVGGKHVHWICVLVLFPSQPSSIPYLKYVKVPQLICFQNAFIRSRQRPKPMHHFPMSSLTLFAEFKTLDSPQKY